MFKNTLKHIKQSELDNKAVHLLLSVIKKKK